MRSAGPNSLPRTPTPTIWHEVSVERGVISDRDIEVMVERGWMEDVGKRILRDLWVKVWRLSTG